MPLLMMVQWTGVKMVKWAIAILVLALLLQNVVTTFGLVTNRGALAAQKVAQKPLLAEVELVRRQLHGILIDTRQLADEGNLNAAKLMDELKRQGIRFTDD